MEPRKATEEIGERIGGLWPSGSRIKLEPGKLRFGGTQKKERLTGVTGVNGSRLFLSDPIEVTSTEPTLSLTETLEHQLLFPLVQEKPKQRSVKLVCCIHRRKTR